MKNNSKTVLIVDDSILIMERMIPIIEEIENISFVVHAGSYEEGLEVLNRLTPDMVLLDINLPDKSGIELLRIIKERKLEIAVLMISNHTEPFYRDICKKLGARYFLDKSSDIDILPSVLAAAC
ncbi:MAG TPA: response regulator transcription factor [Puia sp.]|nr:response regulator transcription factor [Puia sp.]